MGTILADNYRLRAALLGSVFVHAFVAFFVPVYHPLPSTTIAEIVTLHRVEVIRIPHQPPPPAVRHIAGSPVHVKHVQKIAETAHPAPVHKSRSATSPPPASAAASVTTAYNPVPVPSSSGAPSTPSAEPRAKPAPEQVAETHGHTAAGGYMPFGASDDPVLDQHAHDQLQALGVHVTLVVAVGDDGKTKHVRFDPPLSSDLESQILALLENATWDPAYCGGGVPCDGVATIRL